MPYVDAYSSDNIEQIPTDLNKAISQIIILIIHSQRYLSTTHIAKLIDIIE